MEEVPELVLNGLGEIVELADDLLLWSLGVDELHLLEVGDDVLLEGLLDEGHRDLLLRLCGLLQDLYALLIVDADALQHTDGLVQWAVVVILGEGVLLKEFFLDDLGDLESCFLFLIQGIFTYKLHNFDQLVFILKDLRNHIFISHKFWVPGVVVILQIGTVVRVGDVPVDGGEMLSLGELLIQSPEDLHDIEGGGGDWVGEITTWWRHGTYNGNRSLSVWGSEALNFTGSLVELSELGTKMCWET